MRLLLFFHWTIAIFQWKIVTFHWKLHIFNVFLLFFIVFLNDFINFISEGASATEWKFTSAYSVDLDPSRGGEHVQAGFELSTKSGDSIIKSEVHEQYYVINNKIVQWRQFSLPMNQ